MKRTTYQGVKFGAADITIDGEKGKLLQFFDPKTDEYIEFPMGDEDAQHIARLLTGGTHCHPDRRGSQDLRAGLPRLMKRSRLNRNKRLTRKKGLNPRSLTKYEAPRGGYDLDKSAAWHKQVVGPAVKKNPCLVCASQINIEGHHVIAKQEIKRIAKSGRWDFDREQDALWDARNGIPLCAVCHQRHETAFRRVPRRVLPAAALAFADELGVAHLIERYYPEEPVRDEPKEKTPSLRIRKYRGGGDAVENRDNDSDDRGEAG
jgi:hypothetical protein